MKQSDIYDLMDPVFTAVTSLHWFESSQLSTYFYLGEIMSEEKHNSPPRTKLLITKVWDFFSH